MEGARRPPSPEKPDAARRFKRQDSKVQFSVPPGAASRSKGGGGVARPRSLSIEPPPLCRQLSGRLTLRSRSLSGSSTSGEVAPWPSLTASRSAGNRVPADTAGLAISSGTVTFGSEGHRNNSTQFAVLEEDATAEQVLDLLQSKWRLKDPSVVLSLTGGSGSLALDPRQERTVLRGLAQAVRVANAWIFTAGLDEGVSGLVGHKSMGSCPLIGIAPFNHVRHHEDFLPPDLRSSHLASRGGKLSEQPPHSPTASSTGEARHRMKVEYIKRERNSREAHAIDPNHTHILLHRASGFGKEVELRANAEELVRERLRVPGVLIVLKGGRWTLDSVLRHLRKDCPVVLVKCIDGDLPSLDDEDSCADLLSSCFERTVDGTVFRAEMVRIAIELAKGDAGGGSGSAEAHRQAYALVDRFDSFLAGTHLRATTGSVTELDATLTDVATPSGTETVQARQGLGGSFYRQITPEQAEEHTASQKAGLQTPLETLK